MIKRIVPILLAFVAVLTGCVGAAWRNARSEDTISAYHQFLKEHPDSSFSEEARARLELSRLRLRPTRAGFDEFRKKYGSPELVSELRPYVENAYFDYARSIGTAEAYRKFLEEFPAGANAKRALGNAEYLEAQGFQGDLAALSRFASTYPESDYAAEAKRSVAAVRLKGQDSFGRVALLIRVASSTPGADRVARVFRDRAAAAYSAANLRIVPVASQEDASRLGLPAILVITHEEREMSTQLEAGQFTEPGVLARTEVDLRRIGEKDPIWSDVFEYRVPLSVRRDDVSILFGPGSQSGYWAELDGAFFIPVARWGNQAAARPPQQFDKPVVAVKVVGDRAVVLFGDGDFEVLELSDPEAPVRLGEYRRKRDLAKFSGVNVDGSQVALFGPDGIEIVQLDGDETRREVSFGREVVGSVRDAEALGGSWLAATNRGLLLLGSAPSQVQTLVPREVFGMARYGERVLFTDGVALYAATLAQLRNGRVESELRLGRGFAPQRVRAQGGTAVVLGARDAVWVDLRSGQPRLRSRIGGTESGRVRDAAVVGERLFLLGPRGLQVTDPNGERIVDSVDVIPRERIDVEGRHLVMIGERSLQVVDASPFIFAAGAADLP